MVVIVWVGESLDAVRPPRGVLPPLHVIQCHSAAQNHFPADAVGAVTDPGVVGEQVQCSGIEDPPPGLAVVY